MSLLDSLKKAVASDVKQSVSASAREAMNDLGKGMKKKIHDAVTCKSEKITFQKLPTSLEEMQALPECKLDTPFKTAALTLAVLCNYEKDPEATFAMLDYLKGPDDVSTYEKQFFYDCLNGKTYKPFSFFQGATPKNGYKPTTPYTITVSDNEYSYAEENWATMYVESSGADLKRSLKLRKKPSTGQWFLRDIQCLTDIRIPEKEDPWA